MRRDLPGGDVAWAGIEPTPFRTGLFGVTGEQTIRVSVLNAGDERGVIEPCIKIWDMNGNLLFESEGGPLPKGTGAFVDVGPESRPGSVGVRVQLRAEVELEGPSARCDCQPAESAPGRLVRDPRGLRRLHTQDRVHRAVHRTRPQRWIARRDPGAALKTN